MARGWTRLFKSFFLLFLVVAWWPHHSAMRGTFSFIQLTAAWDAEGHQAIAMTAMSALDGKAAAQAKRLMDNQDLIDVSAWAHQVEVKYPKTAAYHYQYQLTSWDCEHAAITDQNCPENQCLSRALQHFYGRLTGRPDLVKLRYPRGVKLTDADAVKLLANLLGDAHQPLHAGFADGRGGKKNATLTFMDAKGQEQQATLFDYWDSLLVQKFIQLRPTYWYGGWTQTRALGENLAALQKEWESEAIDTRHLLFEKWVSESLKLACNNVYRDSESNSIIEVGYKVTPDYENAAVKLIQSQILTAGARTAFVLNTILSERRAAKLKKGSGIEIESEGSFSKIDIAPSTQRYLQSFCINLAIIFVVLAILFYASRFYGNSSAPVPNTAFTRSTVPSKQLEKRF